MYNTSLDNPKIQLYLDPRYRLVVPLAAVFGTKSENGSLTGIVGQLQRKEADVSINPLYVTFEYIGSIDYSSQISFVYVKFITKVPEEKSNWSSIVRPFQIQIWLLIFGSFLVFGLVLNKIINLEDADLQPQMSPSNVYWFLFGIFVYQGGNIRNVNRIRSRFLIGIWLSSIIILVSCYTGTLKSFMTSTVIETLPTTVDELAKAVQKGEYSCGTMNKSLIHKFLKESPLSSMKILGNHIIKNKHFFGETEAWNKVITSRFALIGSTNLFEKFAGMYGSNKFVVSVDYITKFDIAYAFKKDFSYRNKFSKIVTRLFDAGIITKDEHKKQSSFNRENSEASSLTLSDKIEGFGY
ncbi:glutamate receptor ionotropic, delta-2-like [Centruroides sculpturatus]|uniref:glutamate receptor ionotropic, delta-2-like n=1 Tax=Centruroides sculpturatus TaxID=218467 RepID=UPI000C6E44DE|nr:glutamate receptor ionotropic, delta-2-like [Centruroides sculpturatus]